MMDRWCCTLLLVLIAFAGCATSSVSQPEQVADLVTCLATAAAAGADIFGIIASPATDSNKAIDILRKIQEGTKTSSILVAIPSCAKVFSNALASVAEKKAVSKSAFGIAPYPDVRVIHDLKMVP